MKRFILAAALAGTTIAGMAAAQNAAPAAKSMPKRAMALDLNKDGIITRAEVTAAADARFAKLDTNRDGTISASERPNKRGTNMRDMTREQLRQKTLARFDRADGNKDGRLEAAERQAMGGKQRRERAGLADGGPRGGRGEMRHGGRHARGGGMGAMMMADANRDGVLTKAEAMSAAQAMFDKVDTNRDGRIDQAERKEARSVMKMRRGGPDGGPGGMPNGAAR
ncbi:EF-hand domain-containing protein [Sphingomonas radiodurans]|uniref:EF-hand domain-containing protein n=1 Tax=Sphingomonas radiodurans TaxID=2890321 RepID=UPI001E332164|nr:EF-hand domain-containing protein [Sphingomonas radiodurans]WBH16806.1 EF-hand domain-containing protein [Sphingomonas radiodurans]